MRRLLFFLPLVLLLAGCPKSPYRAALDGSDDVGSGVSAAVAVYGDLYTAKLIDDSEKAKAATVLTDVNDGNIAFKSCVDAAHTSNQVGAAPYLACASAFVVKVGSFDPASLGVKNQAAQARLSSYLRAIRTAIDGISLAIQSAKAQGGK